MDQSRTPQATLLGSILSFLFRAIGFTSKEFSCEQRASPVGSMDQLRMKYNYFDAEHYAARSPYLPLKSLGNATAFVAAHLEQIREFSEFIPQFPDAKCEPLIYRSAICRPDSSLAIAPRLWVAKSQPGPAI